MSLPVRYHLRGSRPNWQGFVGKVVKTHSAPTVVRGNQKGRQKGPTHYECVWTGRRLQNWSRFVKQAHAPSVISWQAMTPQDGRYFTQTNSIEGSNPSSRAIRPTFQRTQKQQHFPLRRPTHRDQGSLHKRPQRNTCP